MKGSWILFPAPLWDFSRYVQAGCFFVSVHFINVLFCVSSEEVPTLCFSQAKETFPIAAYMFYRNVLHYRSLSNKFLVIEEVKWIRKKDYSNFQYCKVHFGTNHLHL